MAEKKKPKMKCTTTKSGVKICRESSDRPKAETPISSEGQNTNPIDNDQNWNRIQGMKKGKRF